MVALAGGLPPPDVPAARDFLLRMGIPIVAEATSNLWSDAALRPLLLPGGEATLRACGARRVLRLGCVPSWRWWRDLDDREDIPVLNVCRAPFRGLARTRHVVTCPWEALRECGGSLSPTPGVSVQAGSLARLEGLLRSHPDSEPAWMRHLSRGVSPGAVVMLGNSLPIREWNLAGCADSSRGIVYANRGANGIDGLVSTWLGLSAEAEESWLIVGDLSALYDLGAPWILPQLREARRRIVVINNGGGKIFSRVGWLRQAGEATRRAMENPHAMSFEPWARLWGMDYRLLTTASDLQEGAARDAAGCAVWEVRPDAAQTEGFWSAWQS